MVTIRIVGGDKQCYSYNKVFFKSAAEAEAWYAEQKNTVLASLTEEELSVEPYKWKSRKIIVSSTEEYLYRAYTMYCEGTMSVHEVPFVTINEEVIEAPFAEIISLTDSDKLFEWLMDTVRERVLKGDTITTLLVNGVSPKYFSLLYLFNRYKSEDFNLLPFEMAVKYAFDAHHQSKNKQMHCPTVQKAVHMAALEVVQEHYYDMKKFSDAVKLIVS
jgi:hypothetical protein